MITKKHLTDLIYHVNGAAIEVHKNIGVGLLETIYHQCMIRELSLRGINFKSELVIPIEYKGLKLESNLRCDLFIENCLVLELKAVDKIVPIHIAKLMSYMKLLKSNRINDKFQRHKYLSRRSKNICQRIISMARRLNLNKI